MLSKGVCMSIYVSPIKSDSLFSPSLFSSSTSELAKWTDMFFFIILESIVLNQSDIILRLGEPKAKCAPFPGERQ